MVLRHHCRRSWAHPREAEMQEKKPYETPQCRRLGTYQEITQASHLHNGDVPNGPNTAFS